MQPAPSTLLRTGSAVQSILNERQTRKKGVTDSHRESTNESPVILPIELGAAGVSAALQRGGASIQPAPVPASQAAPAGIHVSGQRQLQKHSSNPVAGRKRKAAESDSSRPDQSSSQISDDNPKQGGRLTADQSISTSQATPDVALPSVEAEPATHTIVQPKRPAPKPRAHTRFKKTAQPATEASELQSGATITQQTSRSQSVRPNASTAQSAAQSEADALLQNVTSQFSAVSRLADGIDGTSRASILARSGFNQPGSVRATSGLANALNRAAHRQTQARTAADLAAEIISEALGEDMSEKPKRKRRKRTPDDAEEHTIDPAETKMRDLTRDSGLGKKSGIEIALENVDWKAVKQQQKEMAAETTKQKEAERQEKRSGKPKKRKKAQDEKREEALVPQMAVVNGVIVSVVESREVDIRREAEAEAAREDANVITIDKLTSRKNQNTIGRPKGLQGKQLQWSEEMDERFYKGIRMFGADMLMVSSLFPKLERRHVKHKFVREERANPEKLREALFNPIPLDAETYQHETGMELGDPRKLDEELKAMEADLRKRFEETLAEQQAGAHPVEVDEADIPLPSREQGSAEPEASGTRAQSGRPGKENRFNAVADDIINDVLGVRSAGAKKGKKKAAPAPAGRKKKDGSVAAPRKGTKAAKQAAALQQLGGTVEEIGTVDEVPR